MDAAAPGCIVSVSVTHVTDNACPSNGHKVSFSRQWMYLTPPLTLRRTHQIPLHLHQPDAQHLFITYITVFLLRISALQSPSLDLPDDGEWGHAMAKLVEALRYKFAGLIPDGDIGSFH
jgi:hypothetical protein